MNPTATLALTAALIALASLLPPALSPAEDFELKPTRELPPRSAAQAGSIDRLGLPPAPHVPQGTKITEQIEGAMGLISERLINPVLHYSNRRVHMSRALVRMNVEFHFAITDTSDSLIPFDVYRRHKFGEWEKVASGVCHPGMDSLKVALPESGVMVEPVKHPLFAAAITDYKKRIPGKRSS